MIKKIISSSIITVLIFFSCALDFLLVPNFALALVPVGANAVTVNNIGLNSADFLIYTNNDTTTSRITLSYCTLLPYTCYTQATSFVSLSGGSGIYNVHLTGLVSNMTYSYSVKDTSGTPYTLAGSLGSFVTKAITAAVVQNSIATSTALLTINTTNDATTTSMTFTYCDTSNVCTDKTPTLTTLTGDRGVYAMNLSGLTVGMKYNYSIKGTSGGGTPYMLDGSIGSFTTVAGGSGPFTASVSGTSTNLVISGNGGGVAIPNSDITVRIGTSTTGIGPITSSTTVNPDGTFSFAVGGLLNPGTTYYYTIADSPTDRTFTVSSASGTFKTSSGGANNNVTISNFSATTNKTGTAITFSATATGASPTVDFDYSFVCGASPTTIGQPSASYVVPMNSVKDPLPLSDTLTILPPFAPVSPTVPYYCEIFNSDGQSLSTVLTVTFASGQPDTPYPSDITDTKATINIKLSSTNMVPPYIVYGDSATTLTSSQIQMQGYDGTNYSGDITGLKASTTYYFQVFPGSFGSQPYGEPTSFKTTDPGAPTRGVIHGTIKPIDTTKYSGGLVTCGTGAVVVDPNNPQGHIVSDYCNFQGLMAMINKFIGIMVFVIAPAVAAICMAWGGFLYMTSAGGEGKGKAKSLLIDAFVGWLLAFASWIIIKFILVQLGYADGWMKFW